jgi:hypothetical protein
LALSDLEGDLTFFGSFGVKIAKDRPVFAAATFGAFIFALLSILHRQGQGKFLLAFLALELVVWHSWTSFQNLRH